MGDMEESIKVCVTGAAGYIGSWLVKRLLEKGYVVHATLRNTADPAKVGLLRSLPGAETSLRLFQLDLYDDSPDFDSVIFGCQFVFHVATPMLQSFHNSKSKYKNTTDAALASINNILESCKRSKSVKRIIYTASVLSASPLKEDGSGYKDNFDESCWTPLDITYPYEEDYSKEYIRSKTLSEKEILKNNDREKGENCGIEVVSLACGLIGGDTLLPYLPSSMAPIISPLKRDDTIYSILKFMQAVMGSVPLLHIDDACEALIFCMEKKSMSGRFLCSASYLTMPEIIEIYRQFHADLLVTRKEEPAKMEKVVCGSTRLKDSGFAYKYDTREILDQTIACAKRLGVLD